MPVRNWSTRQLAEFLDLVSSSADEATANQAAVERTAKALGAKAAAVVTRRGVEASVGFPADQIPERELTRVALGIAETVEVAGVGRCVARATAIDADEGSFLVLARAGSSEFSEDEIVVLRGLSRALGMAVRMLRGIAGEQALRQISEAESRERRQAEANYRRLVERLPAVVYQAEMGERGRWLYVSPQIEEILGFTPEEWMADADLWAKQLHPEDRRRALAQENPATLGDRDPPAVDYRMLTRDGEVVWILDEAVLERNEAGTPVWHGVLYDITERKGAEGELERRAAQQEAVAQLGEQALRGEDLDTLMDATVAMVVRTEGAVESCIWEYHEGSKALLMQAGSDAFSGQVDVLRTATGRGTPVGLALDSGQPVIVQDWSTDKRFELPPALRDFGARSTISVVIAGSRSPFGVLEVHSSEPGRFEPQDVHFIQGAANVLADAIERRVADEATRHRALHDPLTGLPNRTMFADRVQQALRRARRRGSLVAVYFLDLDRFKVINDSLGHATGDELLKEVAPRLGLQLRAGDTVARFGGDEFAVLVDYVKDEAEAIQIADRISAAFQLPFLIRGVEQYVTASIGFAVAQDGSADGESLIRDADAAMYKAKDRGRARAELFDDAMRAGAVERHDTERRLRHALQNDELAIHYQPIVSLSSGEITGVEALVRWTHPERGLVEPAEFIAIAEDSGLVEPIGRWVVQTAGRQTAAWHQLRPDARPIDVCVNLSARQVGHPDLSEVVAGLLADSGLDPAHLCLEITESALVEDSGAVTETLNALDRLGVALVLDDFGTGYSSLAYLNRFPFDSLKIDRSFTDGLGVQQDQTAIVSAIIAMAQALSLTVIAEGVENLSQLNELRRLGCDRAQGYFLSRPLPAEEIATLLAQSRIELPAYGA